MKKVVKLSGKDVKAMVEQIIIESNKLNKKKLHKEESSYGASMANDVYNDNLNRKWKIGRRGFNPTLRTPAFDQHIENFGPITVKTVDGKKVACIGGKCYDENDTPIFESKNKKTKRTIRLTESEMIEFLDKLATRVENCRRRRGLQ